MFESPCLGANATGVRFQRACSGQRRPNVSDPSPFAGRGSTQEVEEGRKLAPKFDPDGLITCVATDAASGDVLMVAHMKIGRASCRERV